jgi:endonuclease/exonuclease/phosphatase family metal-dependent hydrolase
MSQIINHLQLNTSTLRSPEKIIDFIKEGNIDIACLQEISYPIGENNPIAELAKQNGFFYNEAINFYYLPKKQVIAIGIISRFPIIDSITLYYNSPEFKPKEIDVENILSDDPTLHFEGSRAIKHLVKSRSILSTLIRTPNGLIRVVNSHFPLSDLCTEIIPQLEMAKMIWSHIKFSSDIPTIFSADLNIRPQSYSVAKISEVLECHTKDFINILASTHIAKQKDFPSGLAIDHVFSKGLIHKSTNGVEIDFSEHMAIVSEFML